MSDPSSNEPAPSLLSSDLAARLIGVIDLKDGRAVAAVGGQRDRYRPLSLGAPSLHGSAIHLADHYRRLSLRSFYIADLDALCGRVIQWDALDRLVSRCGDSHEVLLDVGWRGNESQSQLATLVQLSERHRALRWIVATESARGCEAVHRLCDSVSPARVLLGLDYHDGQLKSRSGNEAAWLNAVDQLALHGAVVLDVAAVGTQRGVATESTCRRVRQRLGDRKLYSGGGIRSGDDARQLLNAGCDGCLVATALHPA